MRRIVALLIASVVLMLALSALVGATIEVGEKYVYDEQLLFTSEQYEALNNMAKELSKNGDVSFYLTTVNASYYEGEWFCRNNHISTSDNVVLLVINTYDVTELCYDIYTYGDAMYKISDTEIDRIVYHKEIYDNLKANRAYEGSVAYFKYAAKAYNGHLPAPFSRIISVSLIIGTAVAFMSCLFVFIAYKTKQKSTKYPLDRYASLSLTEQHDVFIGKNVTRTRVQSSSGGGSRSGGGSGRGGGGGHRGGA